MSLILAGIDEAGYGPMLGPLCVGMSIFHVENWSPGDEAPCLWTRLEQGVCKHGQNKSASRSGVRRIAYDDSKKLKLANDLAATSKTGKKRHPVMHLELGVLAMLACVGPLSEEGQPPDQAPAAEWECPENDAGLLAQLGTKLPPEPWYTRIDDAASAEYPRGHSAQEVQIAANLLRRAAGSGGVNALGVRCEALGEAEFNAILDRHGSKAAATEEGLARHLRHLWRTYARHSPQHGGPRVVCDRQGGRTQYAQLLDRALDGKAKVLIAEETPERSRYLLEAKDDGRAMTVMFMPEAESAHLPVALASMTAKLVRETLMDRFNRTWCARMPELKPTAGYTQDARRWLNDAKDILDGPTRRQLIRRA